ncbi:YiiX/YebB-like N1pC/P60 family cysteine hydrolase [Salinispirillum marinum]|uniref:YiiX/YebB-like N1pC/P60 family cysteine hydrolase n=2 Tax=Saccharospirillaceae TaxID=255527 RepID=A0ABV8BFB4_9GAMM
MLTRLLKRVEGWLTKEHEDNSYPMSDFERLRHEIKPGDVLLVEGKSRVAEVIKTVTQSRWSHAALYIGRLHDIEDPRLRERIRQFFDGQPDIQLIAESQLGLGTVIRPLYVYDQKHLRICRPRDLRYRDGQQVIAYAVNRLGTEYNIRQIFDLARFYLPWSIFPRRLRSSLFEWQLGGHTRTVCSTMIAEAFASIHYPILPLIKRGDGNQIRLFQRNPLLNVPSDFDYSPYFDIIKYPFFTFASEENPAYRMMPWEGQVSLSDDEKHLYVDVDWKAAEQARQSMPRRPGTP